MPVVFILHRYCRRRITLQSRLGAEGYHTLAMKDAGEALQTLNCVRPDLLVVDVRAVSPDALRLLTTLRNHPVYNELPVLFIGAGLSESHQLRDSVRPGRILLDGHSLDDLVSSVRSYVAPVAQGRRWSAWMPVEGN